MSESLRNDGRIWVPKEFGDERSPDQIPEAERDYFLERRYPAFGNLVPRDVASRAAKREVDAGRGVGPLKNGVYLDFADAIERLGHDTIEERYGNLFQMYERITGEDPYKVPMRIYPAVHYTMGGLWVDYNLMSNIPGLFVLGEANFSDHGANRLGASALMQGLADGYFVLPATIGDYLAPLLGNEPVPTDDPVFTDAEAEVTERVRAAALRQRQPHRRLVPPRARQDPVGQLRHGAQQGEPREGARRDPGAARGVPQGRPRPRRRRVVEPVAGEGRPRRRLPRVRRADGASTRCTARRAAAGTSASSTRPKRARRCATTSTSRTSAAWEYTGDRANPIAAQGAARVRVRAPRAAVATSRGTGE